ncbi:hypothetical protein [Collinsella ihumii]|uniref:hypothetical protein n=1 Tax=Collinsella ihumii TaxID=1720204 RepID=UPI0025AB52D9|nr:hypothetical protein [Collinsella ihumii]MDN0055789.1 hypothetical protein [Collinsella ihumii]
MMLLRLLRRDLSVGTYQARLYLSFAFVLGLLFSLGAAGNAITRGISPSGLSYADAVGEAFNFSSPVNIEALLNGRALSITFPWLLTFASLLAATLDYPKTDAFGSGYRVVVGAGSRWIWWLSKCLWIVVVTAVFWLLFYAGIAVMSMAFQMDMTLDITESGASFLFTNLSIYGFSMTVIPLLLLSVPIGSALGLIQLVIAMRAERIPAYAFCLVLMFVSALFMHPLLPGNYLISGRSIGMALGGMQLNAGLAWALGVGLAAVIVGGLLFSRMTIFGGTRDE